MIAVACTAVLVRLALLPDAQAASIVSDLAVVPSRLLAHPLAPDQWLTVLTSLFLHAGWIHLAGNMLYLLVFGPPVLDRVGTPGFLALYIVSGAVGALAHALAFPSSAAPLVGASGAIAGVLGAHLLLEPRAQVTTVVPVLVMIEVASLPAWFVIALWFVLQLAAALAPVAPASQAATVAWFAHLGGFVTGMALAFAWRVRPVTRKRRRKGRRRDGNAGKRAA